MRKSFFSILFSIVTIAACTKNKPLGEKQYVTVIYKQTFCSDPWVTGSNDSLTLINVANYLDSSGLYVAGLTIKQDGTSEACQACNCKTGKTIYVSTFNTKNLKVKYMRIGFEQ